MAKRTIKNLFKNRQGKWCVDITVGGKRRIRVIGPDKRQAEMALATIRTDLLRGKLGIQSAIKPVPFGEFAKKFLDTYASKKRSYIRDLSAYNGHLKVAFSDIALADINLERVEKYITARRAEISCRHKKTSGATINRELALLRTILNKAVDWEYLNANPINWRRVNKLPENSRERYLTPEEKKRLLEAIDESALTLKAFIILAVNTGMRKGELLGLKWANVNLSDRLICLEQSQRKNGKVLKAPLNQAALDVLRSLSRTSDYVLCDPQTGSPIKGFRRPFAAACKKAGVVDFRIHDLRHTFATTLNARGASLTDIKDLLGHSSVAMTSRYITPISDGMRRAVDSLMDEPREERKKDVSPSDADRQSDGKTVYIQ
jgi:integrase